MVSFAGGSLPFVVPPNGPYDRPRRNADAARPPITLARAAQMESTPTKSGRVEPTVATRWELREAQGLCTLAARKRHGGHERVCGFKRPHTTLAHLHQACTTHFVWKKPH